MHLASGAFALCCLPAFAADDDATQKEFATDRPDFVESANTVGTSRFQIETSVSWEYARDDAGSSRRLATPTLLRLGISHNWELRLESDGYLWNHETHSHARQSGWTDASIGVKWHMLDGHGATPALALLVHADTPSGAYTFRTPGLHPSIRLVAEWELDNGWGIGIMPGLSRERDESGKHYLSGILGVVAGKEIAPGVRLFGEVAAEQLTTPRYGGNILTADAGVAWQFAPDMQLDFAIRRGLNHFSPDWTVTTGFSIRM